MIDFKTNLLEIEINDFQNSEKAIRQRQLMSAMNFFRSTLEHGKITRFKAMILRQPMWLLDLNEVKAGLHVQGSYYSGFKAVPIDLIIGSEGRKQDFDLNFHPVRMASRDRWVALAQAYLSGCPLPPVELIQIGDYYFIRDGHHRISVAATLGQKAIDAEVITFNAALPLPKAIACQLRPHAALQTG